MTTTQKTTRTPVQYNSSGAASDFHGDNMAFIKKIKRA